jgi:hypothetical protein
MNRKMFCNDSAKIGDFDNFMVDWGMDYGEIWIITKFVELNDT